MSTLFTTIYVIWLLSEILLNRLVRSGATDQPQSDKNTLRLIWIVVVMSILAAYYIARMVSCPIGPARTIPYVGIAMVLLGVIARLLIIRSLGRFFTVDVTIREGHVLKTDGIYAYLRHPSYAASLLSFIGFGLSLNNWIALAIVTVAVFTVFIRRIHVEETVLIRQFGEAYIAYQRKTRRLVPFVY